MGKVYKQCKNRQELIDHLGIDEKTFLKGKKNVLKMFRGIKNKKTKMYIGRDTKTVEELIICIDNEDYNGIDNIMAEIEAWPEKYGETKNND
ncbi:MAG: hypothetical protein WDK96_00160 [Candidatus Paceibacterota bacterium]|jgi:hypothetical protein